MGWPRRLQNERTARPGALAAGKDALRLQSRVQLLDSDYEGQYMIGAPSQLHYRYCLKSGLAWVSRQADSAWACSAMAC